MKNILLIDEDKMSVYGISYLLKEYTDVRIAGATNCSEAIVFFQGNEYDLIILDLMLPIGDYEATKDFISDTNDSMFGLQLLKVFRSINEKVKIVGYSIADTKEIRQLFSELNADFLCKLHMDSRDKLKNIVAAI